MLPTGKARLAPPGSNGDIMIDISNLEVENSILPLNTMSVTFTKDPKACKSKREINANTFIQLPCKRKFAVSDRFWESFCALHFVGMNIFEYFDHAEVFERITTVKGGGNVRVSIERTKDQTETGTLLSCTNPGKPILRVNEIVDLIDRYNGEHQRYGTGIIQVSFPAAHPVTFDVAGDDFTTRFVLQMPIDGYGLPSAYLELRRERSSGSIVGMTKAFKTQFQLGKDDNNLYPVLDRAMRTFNNEEGYHAFKKRLEAAAQSWASFHEAGTLHAILSQVLTADGMDLPERLDILKKYNETTGNPLSYYGVTGANELSTRRAKSIPVNATVYDLINFATEVSTHHLRKREQHQRMMSWVGEKLADEYDLEGTVKTNPEFKDFFLDKTKGIIVPGGDRVLQLDGVDNTPAPAETDATPDDSIITDPSGNVIVDPNAPTP